MSSHDYRTKYHGEAKDTVVRLTGYYYYVYKCREFNLLDNRRGHFADPHAAKDFKAKLKKYQTLKREWKAMHKKAIELASKNQVKSKND